jgi:NTP pyrophosphatase (non-canonical NTP hydrolase)
VSDCIFELGHEPYPTTHKRHLCVRCGRVIPEEERMTSAVLNDVAAERLRQDRKWGVQDHSPETWLAILSEEVGEVAKPLADHLTKAKDWAPEDYRAELVQVAAVAVAAIESLHRQEG